MALMIHRMHCSVRKSRKAFKECAGDSSFWDISIEGAQKCHQIILVDDASRIKTSGVFSNGLETHVDLSSDRQLFQAKHYYWNACGTVVFMIQIDFVEYKDVNYVNLTC